ncbi:hypothetical protein HYC85_016512 [Camellia sinensis]|uniref:Alpha/beta hydrolase fold-3 domain-containing protein n=1 Tax=Camellia sinensis TaxID=4442 RepID=A0A7J7H390_CAMSI|nr:hypothetical protein HYC85_016512 [Camellia sinensis]
MDVKQSSCGAAVAAELPWKTRLVVHLGSFAIDACRLSDRILRFVRNLEPKSPPSSKTHQWSLLLRHHPISGSACTSPPPPPPPPSPLYSSSSTAADSSPPPPIPKPTTFSAATSPLISKSPLPPSTTASPPNHRYPSQYDDGFETLKFIDVHDYAVLPSNNIDLNRCFLAGDSAGGNIAHHVAVRYGRHEFEKLNIIGLVEIQPFFGGEERSESELRHNRAPFLNVKRTDWMWRLFLPIGLDRNHEAVSGGDVSATLVVVGGGDPLQDWQRRYVEGLKKSGKEVKSIKYPNTIHSFYMFPELPQLWCLIVEVGNFIQSQSARNA